jgi:hypothetical protein
MDNPKGYVEIKLGKRELPLLFNKRFEAKVCAEYSAGIFKIYEMLAELRIDVLQVVLYYAYEQGMRYKGKEIDISMDEMLDWLDEEDNLVGVYEQMTVSMSDVYKKKQPDSSSSASSNSDSNPEKSVTIPPTK